MGVFDYERLKNSIKEFSYISFNYPSEYSTENILKNSFDGIIYEKRTTEIITTYDSSNKPVTKSVNRFNPVVDLNKVTDAKAKEILNTFPNTSQFAYRSKEISNNLSQSNANVSEYGKLVKNASYFLPIARSLKKTFPARVFNENIFKVTKLREEIYFINVTIKQQDKNRIFTILAVNDKSFWKRFNIKRIDLETDIRYTCIPRDYNNSAFELINECIRNPSSYIISMRYIYDEETKQLEYFNTLPEEERPENPKLEANFIDPDIAIIEFTGVTHYNKRAWLAFLAEDGYGITYENESDKPNLASYKAKNSNTYYPGDESEICMTYR